MNGQLPDEAAGALAEIRQRQERVIDAVLVPGWYWWVIAAGMVAIGAAVDTRRHAVLATLLPIAIVIIVVLTVAMILGGYRRVQVHGNELLGNRGAVAIVGFVWLIIGLTLGVAFALRAAGTQLPATIATAIGGLVMIGSGPLLMRRLRKIMLGNRAGIPR